MRVLRVCMPQDYKLLEYNSRCCHPEVGGGGQKTAAGPGEDPKVGGRQRGMRVEKAYLCSGGS